MTTAQRKQRQDAAGELLQEAQTERLLRIGGVANRTGIGIETLWFYERSGLLDRPGA